MSSQAVVVTLCALSFVGTSLVLATVARKDDERVAALQQRLDAAEKRAASVDALRGEVRELRDRIDRRGGEVAGRVGAARPAADAPRPGRASMDAASTEDALPGADPAKPLEERIAESVERRVSEKIEAMTSRDKERGDDGKWKAPIEELTKELKLNDTQLAEAKRIFDHGRDETFTMLKTQRLDGSSILDDYATVLKSGADPVEATRQLFSRILTERVPGSEQTYLAQFIAIHQDVEEQLGTKLDKDQMKRLRSLRVDLLDVKTGYDPVGDYVRAKVQ